MSSSSGTIRPNASLRWRIRSFLGFGSCSGSSCCITNEAGARSSAGSFSSSSTSAAVKKSCSRRHTAAIGVPVKISSPSTRHPEAHDRGADRRHHARERVRDRGSHHARRGGDRVVAGGRGRVARQQRQEPEDPGAQHRESDEHPHTLLARGVAEQQDAPIHADEREGDRRDPPGAAEQPRQEIADRSRFVEPQSEHRHEREHHQEDPERVPSVRRQDLPDRGLRRRLLLLAARLDRRFAVDRLEDVRRVDEARDDERREGEVFVAIGRSSLTPRRAEASSRAQASMITGRITGLRCVTSTK